MSLPNNTSAIRDIFSKGEKFQMVAETLYLLKKQRPRNEALKILGEMVPTDWGTNKDSVQLVQEAREDRTKQILSNQDFK